MEITSGRHQSTFALCHHVGDGHREKPIEGYQQLLLIMFRPSQDLTLIKFYDEIISLINEQRFLIQVTVQTKTIKF